MKVLVTGGTGTLGRHLAVSLVEAGHDVRVMSRRERVGSARDRFEWAQADLETGEGLDEATAGVDAVIHAATSVGLNSKSVDVDGTQRLIEASERHGVAHFIYPSIVGIDEIPFSYYENKLEAERLLQESDLPHTILRITQFHELIDQLLGAATQLPVVTLLPVDFQVQSIAAVEAAEHLAGYVEDEPQGRRPDLGGPEVMDLGEMARIWMEVENSEKRIVRLPLFGKVAEGFRKGKNTVPRQKIGTITWKEWLMQRQ